MSAPGGCGVLDPAACITDAFNSLIGDAVTSAVDAGLGLLSATLLATPRVDQVPRVAQLWNSSWQLVLALYGLVVVLAAIAVMVAGVQGQATAREALPRLAVGFVAGALSLPLAGMAIDVANALARGVLGEGLDPASAVNGLAVLLGTILVSPAGGFGLVGFGLGLLVVIELGAVLVVFIARVVLTVLLVVAAPLALLFHALPQTEAIARWWWRAFAGVLAVQVLQSLTLVTALRVVLGPDGLASGLFPTSPDDVAGAVVNALVLLVVLWVLWRIPFWVWHAVRGSHGGSRRGFVGSVVRTATVAAAFTAFGGPAGAGVGAGAGAGAGVVAAGRGGLGRLAGAVMGRAAGRGLAGLVNGGANGGGAAGGAPGGGRRAAPATSATTGTRGARARPGEPGGDPDPYARVQAERDGQLRLPLGLLPRSPSPGSRGPARPGGPDGPARPGGPAGQGGPGAGRGPGRGSGSGSSGGSGAAPRRGRQLRLAFDQPPPDPFAGNRPVRGGPNAGQYPLPLGLARRPRAARPATPPAPGVVPRPAVPPASGSVPARGRRPAGRGVQLELPLDPYRGNRPLRGGPDARQYPLPLGHLPRRPPPPAPPPAPAPPPPPPPARRPARPAGRPPGVQLELPFDPYRDVRALRGGQYPLPLDGVTSNRPTPPPPTPPPPAQPAPPPPPPPPRPARAARRRDPQMPLPLDPAPRRGKR